LRPVKLSPFYAAFAHFAGALDRTGADGLVLFNRFYQPDIDPEELAAARTLHLSDSSELRLGWRFSPGASAHRLRSPAASTLRSTS
jgi:dihydroorotate dehydrogenase (fumarate)